jgi:sarcosine oxidase, subunit gamma
MIQTTNGRSCEMTNPLTYLRRAPLRRQLESANASWSDLGDTAVAASVPSNAGSKSLYLADLSALPRIGFKGRGTVAAMKARGVMVEAEPNKAFVQENGGLCLVLAPGEVILLGDPLAANAKKDLANFDQMLASWKLEDEERTYPLLRRDSHAWFALGGEKSAHMLAKVCAVDLRPHKFTNLSIAQTSVAKMSAIVTRADIGDSLNYHLLADSAAALYFWGCLMDAAHEFGGQIVGLTALQELSRHDKTR